MHGLPPAGIPDPGTHPAHSTVARRPLPSAARHLPALDAFRIRPGVIRDTPDGPHPPLRKPARFDRPQTAAPGSRTRPTARGHAPHTPCRGPRIPSPGSCSDPRYRPPNPPHRGSSASETVPSRALLISSSRVSLPAFGAYSTPIRAPRPKPARNQLNPLDCFSSAMTLSPYD